MSVRLPTKSFLDFNERSQALESWKFIFESYLIRHLQWELAADH